MQSESAGSLTVVLGTGGTIAGTAARADDAVGYRAAQLGVAELVAAVPPLAGVPLESEQVAQLDSKDMDFATWRRLALRTAHHLARPEVGGVVVTHGTDTLEETACFMQRLLAPAKPVVLTAAMRPATALLADGRQNLLDAVRVARESGACGVVVAFAGRVFDAVGVRKVHGYRLDAFDAGEGGPLGVVEEGRLRRFRDWPRGSALGVGVIDVEEARWPRVDIVLNHVGADGDAVRALVAPGADGIVVAGTGNAAVSAALERALAEAAAAGVAVRLSTRCAAGGVVGVPGASALSAVQARVELILELLAARGA
ncbi:MAG: asparaginase [Betaproteobacteria bacterium]